MLDIRDITIQNIKKMNEDQLADAAKSIRSFLVENVMHTGGHLASNLGIVELTLALHRVFDSPKDKIVWDVGHQSYVHKILTGRTDQFATLRQMDGICGFPRRTESEHDAFDTGHSTTSLSAAMGIARGLKQQGIDQRVVAVIGDGALTGGMAFEAINNIALSKTPMIIVLNDNGMAISKNVGAIHYHLSSLRSTKGYIHIKKRISERLPRIKYLLERAKNSLKYLLVRSAFFEEMGLKYLGPIDGHDQRTLEEMMKKALNFDVPVLLHVSTVKGKGYEQAENNPEKFHGVSPAISSIERTIQTLPNNSQVFASTLVEIAKRDKRIVGITAAMPKGTALDRFATEFPDRFYDVGIAEQHAVTFAAGLATTGIRPVFAVYSTFLQRAYDQILHDVALQKLPVVFAVDRAGLVGEDGATHHGVYDIAYLSQMPGMVCCAPATQQELESMIQFACAYQEGPISIRYPRGNLLQEPLQEEIKLGKWAMEGALQPIAIIAVSDMLPIARECVKKLQRQGLSAVVINARFIKPLDTEMLRKLLACQYIAVIEDGIRTGGLGEQVAAHMANEHHGSMHIFALPEEPMLHGKVDELLALAGLDAETISQTIAKDIRGEYARKNQA